MKLGKAAESDLVASFLVNLGMTRIRQALVSEASDACNEAWRLAKRMKDDEVVEEADHCLKVIKEHTST